jgi:putative endonuclease
MQYFVYLIVAKNKNNNFISYVGYTSDIKKRLILHNSSKGAKFTRGRKWMLIYKEKFKSKKEAISREYYIKNNRALRNKIKNENFNSITL